MKVAYKLRFKVRCGNECGNQKIIQEEFKDRNQKEEEIKSDR